jgi:hypothetical protein
MWVRTQRPVYSRHTASAVRPLRRCTSTRSPAWAGRRRAAHVVGFAVELDQLTVEIGADRTHGVLAEGEHLAGEHRQAVRGHEHQMRIQRRHAVPGAAI